MKVASKIYGSVRNENSQLPTSYHHACQKNKYIESWMEIVKWAEQ